MYKISVHYKQLFNKIAINYDVSIATVAGLKSNICTRTENKAALTVICTGFIRCRWTFMVRRILI